MKSTAFMSLAVVASAFSLSAATSAPDRHRVLLDRMARTKESDRTGHQVQQVLARYSQPSIAAEIVQQQQQELQHERVAKGERRPSLEQQVSGIPSRVLRRLRGQAHMPMQEQRLEQEILEQRQRQQQQQQGQGTGSDTVKKIDDEGKDKDKEELVSVKQLRQFDSASSRRPKAIDSERIPIEYNPSEVAFVGQVGIGTPNQYFNLEFDIGSSDIWVTSAHANCSQNRPCSTTARRGFHIERSSTFESAPNISWHLELSDGPIVKGSLATDVVQVAGFVVDRQVIAIADSLTGIKENGIDGSFGLGLMDLSFNGDPTPVDNLINSNAMRSEVGVWFGTGNQGGELTFGGQDPARYTGSLSYYNVPPGSAYWSTPIHSLTVIADTSIQLKDKIPRNKRTIDRVDSRIGTGTGISVPNVIFDTSTNIIMVPPRVAQRTHQLIHNSFFSWYSVYSYISGLYTVSCDLGLIDLWFDLGPPVATPAPSPSPTPETVVNNNNNNNNNNNPLDKSTSTPDQEASSSSSSFTKGNITTTGEWTSTNKFRIRGQDLVRERVPVVGGLLNICFSGIQASKNDEDDWVFGNIWFKNNYMTLDHRRRRVGVAPAVQS